MNGKAFSASGILLMKKNMLFGLGGETRTHGFRIPNATLSQTELHLVGGHNLLFRKLCLIFWGGRWESNPHLTESQSVALPI